MKHTGVYICIDCTWGMYYVYTASMQMMHVCGKINDMETLSYLLATTRGGFKLFLWLRAWLTHLSYLLASTNNEIDREEKNCRNSQELKVIGKKRFWGK